MAQDDAFEAAAEDADAQAVENAQMLEVFDDAELLALLKVTLEGRPSVVQELVDWAIPDKAYASSRLMVENRLSGTIKSFFANNGYGFIDCPEVKEAFGNDVFLHHSQVNNFAVGQEVTFAILLNKERKPQAFDLSPPQDLKGQKGGCWGTGQDAKGQKGGGGGCNGGKGWSSDVSQGSFTSGAIIPGGKKGWQAKNGGAKGSPMGKGPMMFPGGVAPQREPTLIQPRRASLPLAHAASFDDNFVPETSMDMPGVTDRRFEGVVKSFNEVKGFGFIAADEIMDIFACDCFLHKVQLKHFEVGQTVSFAVFLNKDQKPQAKDLQAAGGAKRAAGGAWGGGPAQKWHRKGK